MNFTTPQELSYVKFTDGESITASEKKVIVLYPWGYHSETSQPYVTTAVKDDKGSVVDEWIYPWHTISECRCQAIRR